MKRLLLSIFLAAVALCSSAQYPIYTRPSSAFGTITGTLDNVIIGSTTPAAITGTTITATTKFVAPNGTKTVPGYSFVGEASSGLFFASSGNWALTSAGTTVAAVGNDSSGAFRVGSGSQIGWSSIADPTSAVADTILVRDGAANTLALKNANAAQEFRLYAGNGGFISHVKSTTESLTILASPTTVSATTIPAGAQLQACAVRVTTVIPTAATFTVTTTTGGTTLNTAAVSTAATSTDPGTAAGVSYRAASTTITITPNLTPGAATGVVRLQCYYSQVTPPTS